MVDASRARYSSIIGLLYFERSGAPFHVLTVAEIIACSNLGVAGRMVTVRGVARAVVRGLSEEVASLEEWGLALVEEQLELSAADLPSAIVVASELDAILSEIDLSAPAAPASSGHSGAQRVPSESGENANAEDEIPGVDLWTHERVSAGERFASIGKGGWAVQRSEVEGRLAGVPLRIGETLGESDDARRALTCFYAALGNASLGTRVDLFGSIERSLTERLEALLKLIQEKQGMAVARRSLASLFGGTTAEDG
eukprot:CAMPEP_0183392336 /NCGR_PEP_ID=MMETSP0370-20130417/7072_1 /TAXON_ID=268820 /ORGANISM="Peridinium aciculiferum, Strain PAER-2" /LENGTH=254 /DNA_ID=CAMNT_0025572247 /DNA_START=537 /DNA_END=1301 /DNA_ORIENTATION=+